MTDTFPWQQITFSGFENLPAGISGIVNAATHTITFTGDILQSGDLNAGTFDIVFQLNNNYTSGTCFANTGTIAMPASQGPAREATTTNNTSGARVCVLGMPDLWIQKTVITGFPRMARDPVVYRLTFGNSGTTLIT